MEAFLYIWWKNTIYLNLSYKYTLFCSVQCYQSWTVHNLFHQLCFFSKIFCCKAIIMWIHDRVHLLYYTSRSTLMLSSMLWEVLPLSICSQCFHAGIISLWMHRRIDLGLGCLYTSVTVCVVKMTNCECTHSCPPPLFHDLRVFHIDPSFSCKLPLIVLIWNHELEKYIKYEQSLRALSKTEDFFFVMIAKHWKNKHQLKSTAN